MILLVLVGLVGQAAPALAAQAPQSGSIDGLLWTDVNGNGLPDEDPLVGVDLGRVHLFDITGAEISVAVSDRDGVYHFDALSSGQYTVTLEPVVSYQPRLPQSKQVDLQPATAVTGVDFALVPDVGWSDSPLALFVAWPAVPQGIVAGGTVTRTASSMVVEVDVPGQVEDAYLLWGAHGWASTDSLWGRIITFDGVSVEAQWDYSSGWRFAGGVSWAFAYGAEVSELVRPGLGRYELTGFSSFLDDYSGAALLVRYSQPDLPTAEAFVQMGQDLLYAPLGTYRGPDSQVVTWSLDAQPREQAATLHLLWTAVQPQQDLRIWARSGRGQPPAASLIDAEDAWVLAENPLRQDNGQPEVCTFDLTLPPRHSYLQLQIESVDDRDNSAQVEWLAAVLELRAMPEPSFVVSEFGAQAGVDEVRLRWRTLVEDSLVGFHVWGGRRDAEPRWRLTPDMIPAWGRPARYGFVDGRDTVISEVYWLEAVTEDGSFWLGPVAPLQPAVVIPLPF